MRRFLNLVKRFRELNLGALLRLRNSIKSSKVTVKIYPGVQVSVAKTAKIVGAGHLQAGTIWSGAFQTPSKLVLAENSTLILDGDFRIMSGFSISVNPGATLKLGSGYINDQCTIDCFEQISIGKDVAISKHFIARDSDNHSIDAQTSVSGPIHIRDHVWIGMRAMILKNVEIKTGAVVAAGAVVVRDVAENTLVGGVPARPIKSHIEWK